MDQGSDRLHFNGVSLVQGLVQKSWRVDDLPLDVVVISMPDIKRLGCEGIGLDIDIGVGNLVHEAGFTDIREASDEESSGVGIDAGHSGQMLSDFVQEAQ